MLAGQKTVRGRFRKLKAVLKRLQVNRVGTFLAIQLITKMEIRGINVKQIEEMRPVSVRTTQPNERQTGKIFVPARIIPHLEETTRIGNSRDNRQVIIPLARSILVKNAHLYAAGSLAICKCNSSS